MKSMRKVIPALALLLVSAVILSSASYAWFSMNTTVTATGMTVNAKAEAGLVISNSEHTTYDVSATTTTSATSLVPGSTSNGTDWYHSTSTNPSSANPLGVGGATYTTGTENTNYVKNEFYIRSSADAALTVASLDIKSVKVASSTQNLSKSLRVGVLMGSDTTLYIYAPVTGYTSSYTVKTTSTPVTVAPKASTDVTNSTAITSIPGNTENGIKVTVFIWFEGEDASCISNNIVSSLESLVTSVEFSYTA